jgi:hypothetical protein
MLRMRRDEATIVRGSARRVEAFTEVAPRRAITCSNLRLNEARQNCTGGSHQTSTTSEAALAVMTEHTYLATCISLRGALLGTNIVVAYANIRPRPGLWTAPRPLH